MATTFETTQTAGPDGLVHLTVPVPNANQPYRLVVAIEPSLLKEIVQLDDRGYPVGYFEKILGSWEGDFPELYEGDFEKRDEL
jgi:hypothetical protein